MTTICHRLSITYNKLSNISIRAQKPKGKHTDNFRTLNNLGQCTTLVHFNGEVGPFSKTKDKSERVGNNKSLPKADLSSPNGKYHNEKGRRGIGIHMDNSVHHSEISTNH